MIEVVPASARHVNRIAKRMQLIDQLECKMMRTTPKAALRMGLLTSLMAWTVMIDGEPEAMFGVVTTSLLDNSGRPWLLMTDVAAAQKRALVRLGAKYTEALHKHFALLHNHVHADNHKAIRWLSRLGYVVGPADVINGQPMRPFALCAFR